MSYEPVGLLLTDLTRAVSTTISNLPGTVSTVKETISTSLAPKPVVTTAPAPTKVTTLTPVNRTTLIAPAPVAPTYVAAQSAPALAVQPATPWTKYALYAGLAVGAFFLIKKLKRR